MSDLERLRKWARRRPVLAGSVAGTAILVLLVAAVSTGSLAASRLAHERTRQSLARVHCESQQAQRELELAVSLASEQTQAARQAEFARRSALCRLQETEQQLSELQNRYQVLLDRREETAGIARLALAREMAAEGRQLVRSDPAKSLLLAGRSLRYLRSQGQSSAAAHEQTLRSALALVGDQALRGHSGRVEDMAVSRSGRWLLTASCDGSARLWDLHAADLHGSCRVLLGHQAKVRLAAITPNDSWAVTAGEGAEVLLWNLKAEDPAASPRVLTGHSGRIYDLAVSSDNRWLAVAGAGAYDQPDNTTKLWDLKSSFSRISKGLAGAEPPLGRHETGPGAMDAPQVLRGHLGPVLAVDITPDCRWVVTASEDGTVRLFDLTAQSPAVSQVVLRGHTGPVTSVATSPDGRWMVTGSRDRSARLWDLSTPHPGQRSTVLAGHQGWIRSIAISSSGRWVATAAHDRTVRLWDMNSTDPAVSCAVLTGHHDHVGPLVFTPDGRYLVTGGADGAARIWNLQSVDPGAESIVLQNDCGPVTALAVSPDSRTLWTSCGEESEQTNSIVRRWDLHLDDVLDASLSILGDRMAPAEQERLLLETAQRSSEPSVDQKQTQ